MSQDGSLSYEPIENYYGTDSFDVLMRDAIGAEAVSTVHINVLPVNDAPAFVGPLNFEGSEDEQLQFALQYTDVEGDSAEFSLVASPPGWEVQVDGANVSVMPAADDFGEFEIQFAVSDENDSTTEVVVVSLLPINDAPVVVAGSTSTQVTEGSSTSAAVPVSDPDGDELIFEVSTPPQKGSVSISAAGQYTYRANPGQTGSDSFTVTVTDASGETVEVSIAVRISARPVEPESGGGTIWLLLLLSALALFIRQREVRC